jgi:PEP-CTERM motif
MTMGCKKGRGMTNRLRSCLLAAAASLGLGAFAPAHALAPVEVTPPPASDFVFIETPGQYTIINNAPAGWYIWGFDVLNPAAAGGGGSPSTTQGPDIWEAGDCDNNCEAGSGVGFYYQNPAGAYSDLGADVASRESSNLFYFVAPEASAPAFYVTNGSNFYYITPTGSIPEPSTWAMLIAGFGFLGWRYGAQRGGLKRLFRAA